MKRPRLGELLIKLGLITPDKLTNALDKQLHNHERLGQILLKAGWLSEDDLIKALAVQLNIVYINLNDVAISSKIIFSLPQTFVERYEVIPISIEKGKLKVAMADPTDELVIREIEKLSGLAVEVCIAPKKEIMERIRLTYGAGSLVSKVQQPIKNLQDNDRNGMPIVELVNAVIHQALNETASDIHIEPLADQVRIRFRIDGLLRQFFSFPLEVHVPLVSRIKVIGELNIAEKRLPQDGRMSCQEFGKEIDFRISSIPTLFGEKLVLRILNRNSSVVRIENLGLSGGNLQLFQEICQRPCGIVLATGPTGSGKTTTLYSILTAINNVQKNIVTIEDPVEYRLPGINQMQVNNKSGLTFSRGLRALLRQDPDVIMVGEIRDNETAAIAVRAALTGHLVLSTLHTNDASSAVIRLLDMGVEPFLLAATLNGILAQRLVRRICPDCKEQYDASGNAQYYSNNCFPNLFLHRGKGCLHCGGTGYHGRLAIHEVISIDDQLRELIRKGADGDTIKKAASLAGSKTLYEDGLEKILQGETTLEEVRRVVYMDDD